ncbi:conserved protein of unknown function [Thermococcus camini]|uniref:Uncharacterized protein n=2 Tax=Thermococcus camini TaxID=2016373 RepID=A0A7G2DBR4_9EURY|nr:conserved protein of unknown function [Thermococcus camini]
MEASNGEDKWVDQFKDVIRYILGNYIVIEDIDDSILIKTQKIPPYPKREKQIEWEISKEKIQEYFHELERMNIPQESETVLYHDNFYETIVQIPSKNSLLFSDLWQIERDPLKVEDNLNSVTYELGKPSDPYILYMLKVFYEKGISQKFLNSIVIRRHLTRYQNNDFFYVIWKILPVKYTVRVHSQRTKSLSQFEKLSEYFLFTVSYNLDIPLIKVRTFEDIYQVQKFKLLTRGDIQNIEPPRRRYIPDLLYHYQLAIASDNPILQFLSFYHIIEHFFEEVYQDEIVSLIQKEITKPDFSYRRIEDLRKLYAKLKRKIDAETSGKSELDALKLTLKKFVDLVDLKNILDTYDPLLSQYYMDNEVSFSRGNRIPWDGEPEKIYSKIAERIYKTRNAIVHSKNSYKATMRGEIKELPKYTPFKHDKDLQREIPLLRFIAEQIIINSAQPL